jgi:inosose dehydratase
VALLAGGAGLLAAAGKTPSRLSLEGYIWQNYAALKKRPLAEMLDELFATAPYGGFESIELNNGFFTPALRDKVIALSRANHLSMPSVYVGGSLRDRAAAQQTTAHALEIGGLCREFRCTAIVNNPDTKAAGGRKTDEELAVQSEMLNVMGKNLAENGFQLRVHHHTAELAEDAREWRHILHHTDPKYVTLCLDLEHAVHGGMEPNAMLREAGSRISEVHLRNKIKDALPTQSLDEGDIDHNRIAATIRSLRLKPLVVVELAYHDDTPITRSFPDNIKVSRIYAERLFLR